MSSGSSPFRSFRFLRHHMASRDVGRIEWSETFLTISRSPRSHCRSNSSYSLAFAKKNGHISAGLRGRITTSRRTKRTPRRTSSGSSSRLSHADCCRTSITLNTQSQSTFFWSHNTNMQAAMNILRNEELIRPSKWQEHPSPNRECSNWNEVWLPPMGFYCRGSLQSQEAAIQSAAQFAGIHTDWWDCSSPATALHHTPWRSVR